MAASLDIRLQVPLSAAPERAWRALTSPRELSRWWLADAWTEPRNLGRLRLSWPAGAAFPVGRAAGVYVDLEPGRKLAWLWRPAPEGVPPLVSVFLEPGERGCRATLHHAGFAGADRELYARWRAGWEDCLERLRRHLGGKERAPASRTAGAPPAKRR